MWPYFFILVVHFFSDFVLQTREMARNKSNSFYFLTLHVFVYTFSTVLLWIICLPIFFNLELTLREVSLTIWFVFITHWLTDKITSNITKYYHKVENEKMFFTTIGADQVLHFLQMFWVFDNIILK